MQPSGNVNGDAADGPFASETHVRVLDVMERRPVGMEIHAISCLLYTSPSPRDPE